MAIVKLQNGNVLLKDGKVSCSCCAAPGCCMYPAQALIDGLYTFEDLPDELVVYYYLGYGSVEGPIILPKNAQPVYNSFYDVTSLYGYIDESIVFVGYDNSGWASGNPGIFGVSYGSQCLFLSIFSGVPTPEEEGLAYYWIYDNFADTYTVTYTSDITCESTSSTVTRESLCVWRGIADDGTTITLEIEFGSFDQTYAWTTNAPNCGANKRGIGMPFDRYNNLGRLNTPLGNYEDEITPGSIIHTVS